MENNYSTQAYNERVCTNYVANMKQLMDIIDERLNWLENCYTARVLFSITLHKIARAVNSLTVEQFNVESLYEMCELFTSMAAHMKSSVYGEILFKCAQKMDNLTSSVSEFINYGEVDRNIDLLAKEEEE